MNSSGIKRGLAATAVAALAVTGLPFLATSASAAPGDTLSQGATGPVRNANAAGGTVTIKSNSASIDPAQIRVTDASYAGANTIAGGNDVTSPAFDVDVLSFTLLDPNKDGDNNIATGDLKFADGTYHYNLQTAVTLGTAAKATFGIVEDVLGDGVNASDPKTLVEVTPTGAPATAEITPDAQTTATGVQSPAYTVTVKDAAGNVTQLVAGESLSVASPQDAVATGTLDSTTLDDGVATFTATAPTAGAKTLNLTDTGIAATITDSATLNVIAQATIAENEFDLATGADTWSAASTFGSVNTQIRVDQGAVTFNFVSKDGADLDTVPDDANKVVLLTLSSGTLKFGGKASETYAVVLDAEGKGSLTVNPTGIVAGSTFDFASVGSGIAATTVTFNRASASSVASDASVYVTKVGSATPVTVTVKDQFGNPIGAPAQVSITRGARNGSTTTDRVTVDATGKATFSLPDAGVAPGTEAFTINLFDDQFDGTAASSAGGTINYTADGLGADPVVTGATADPAATVIAPLYDSAAGAGDSATINITGATAGTPAKVTVDNGALILTGGETNLTQGAGSETITLAGGNGSFTVVGTKTGVVNVTIENGGRTKTVKLTVKQATDGSQVATARNVDLTGPEKAKAGDVATFTAKVTDAFGNPVPGVPASSLGFVISGPANMQSQDAVTDANGEFKYNVLLTDNANSQVKVTVTGTGQQFGKAANSMVVANDAPGLSASDNTDDVTITDVVNIAELEAAVAEAQEKVDNAQDVVDAAQDNLAIAKAERSVAQREVKAAKADLKKAKRQGKGVAAARKALREARGDLRIATAKVNAAQAAFNRANARLAAAQAQLEAAEQALEDAQNS